MKISFTKIMCSIMAFMALSSSAFAFVAMGYHWVRWIVFVSVSAGVWIGFPSVVLVMLRKLDDDRGRPGIYSYLDSSASLRNDYYHVIYPVCTGILVATVLAMWIGCGDVFAIEREVQGTFAVSDTGRPLTRSEAVQMVTFCTFTSLVVSLFMAYLQRGKGKFLVGVSLLCGAVSFVLGLTLFVKELT